VILLIFNALGSLGDNLYLAGNKTEPAELPRPGAAGPGGGDTRRAATATQNAAGFYYQYLP